MHIKNKIPEFKELLVPLRPYPPYKIYQSKDEDGKLYVCHCCLMWKDYRDENKICDSCLSKFNRDKVGRAVARKQKRIVNKYLK